MEKSEESGAPVQKDAMQKRKEKIGCSLFPHLPCRAKKAVALLEHWFETMLSTSRKWNSFSMWEIRKIQGNVLTTGRKDYHAV